MSITNVSGPLAVGLADPYNPNSNPEVGPSMGIMGFCLMDPRGPWTYKSGQDFGQPVAGWFSFEPLSLNITPAAASAAAIAAAAHTVSGTPMTLVSSSGAGIVVGASVTNYNTGAVVTGLLAVGQAAARVSFGSAGTIQPWDPTTLTARCVIITCNNASGTGGNFTIAGFDIYGVPMTETLTSAPGSSLTVTGKKAWKYIQSITPNFTDATYTYSVGTTDLYGLPIATNFAGDVYANFNATGLTTLTTYVAGVTTAATATTGDVRGTIGLPSAADGTKRLMVYQTILLPNLALANGVAGTSTGIYGVVQA